MRPRFSFLVAFVATLIFAAAARATDEPKVKITLTPEQQAKCAAAGGCVLVTKRAFNAILEKIAEDMAQEAAEACAAAHRDRT